MQRNRVIIADDDDNLRQHVAEILADEYELVAFVKNGLELVVAVRRLQPDLIVVDISMPVMNGFEAVRQIKLDGVEVPVVYFTTNAHHAYIQRAFKTGAAGYVLKGFAVEELSVALKAALNGRTFISPSVEYPYPPTG